MRFGIMAMQLNALIPPASHGLPPEQVLARVLGFDQVALVRDLAAHGFSPIELGSDLAMLLPQTFAPPAIEGLAALRKELGLVYTVHLPLWSIEPSTLHSSVRQGSVTALVDAVQVTLPLQPEVYVLHATGALAAEFYRMHIPEVARAVLMGQFQERARQSLRTLLEATGLPARRLAIETIEFPFNLTLDLAEEFDLSICFDTGHVLSGFSGPVDFFEALEHCLPRLAEVHLHDSPDLVKAGKVEYGKDHQALGSGELDLARLLDRLQQAAFEGPLIFELHLEQALSSMEVVRSLRPDLLPT